MDTKTSVLANTYRYRQGGRLFTFTSYIFPFAPSFPSFTPSGYVKLTNPMREIIIWRNNMVVVSVSLMDSTWILVCRFAFFSSICITFLRVTQQQSKHWMSVFKIYLMLWKIVAIYVCGREVLFSICMYGFFLCLKSSLCFSVSVLCIFREQY